MRSCTVLHICIGLIIASATPHAQALIESARGNDPVADMNWPTGAVDLANFKTRVGWWEGPPFGGGERCFQYRGDTAACTEAPAAFARVKAPQLLLIVHEGPGNGQFLKDSQDPNADTSLDWELTLWTPENFHRLFNNPKSAFDSVVPEFRGELPPPKLDVYPSNGRIDWSRVAVPANVTVRDERAIASGYKVEDGSVVRGAVYDMLTSKPIAGVDVTIERRITSSTTQPTTSPAGEYESAAAGTSDADGHYQITHIAPGGYRIVLRHAGHAARMLGWFSFGGHTLKTFTTQMVKAVDATLTVSQASGERLTGVEVRCENTIGLDGRGYPLPEEPAVVSDMSGSVTFSGLPRGYAQFFASAKGFHQLEMMTLRELPVERIQLVMAATGSLRGHVKLAPGVAATNVHVQVRPEGEVIGKWSGSMQVKPDGTFAFDDVPPGRYFASTDPMFAFTGKDANAATVTVGAGKVSEVEVSPPPAPVKPPRRAKGK
ncbi:MAG TPA: carboxypeptidase-like regulatory domain-containing protein [Tepidisphaeraceae bacterium]|nr:carboxypeptidase-like regulatory domain-containing protein [Tepidisphaeraceae bacterium]